MVLRKAPILSSPSLSMTPGDVLLEIALNLEARRDVLNFCLASKHTFNHASAVLYEYVVLESVEQCTITLGMLARTPGIARHVRELAVRPQGRHQSYLSREDNAIASAAMREAASSKNLDALVKFHWDADQLPFCDDMWFALRAGCPQVRYIGTSIGSELPFFHSHLLDFQDLKGFYLNLRHGFYDNHTDLFMDEDDPVFRKFWKMLLFKCPNLEELAIEGYSSVPADVRFLVEGRWPQLKKLSLGDVCVDWFPRSMDSGEKRPFVQFLEEHPSLESITLSRHNIQPIHLATVDPSALGKVTSFTGTHQQLHSLPHLHPQIKDVTFRDPVETRDISAPTVASLLRDLTALTSLKISFTLHSMYDSGNLLRSLIHSCRTLRHLELTCAHKPSFQLDTFAKTIRGFPKLRTLKLAVVKYPGDDTIAAGAVRIARANPHLRLFQLSFIPPVYPVSLPYAIPYRHIPFPCSGGRAVGVFEVSCDEHGLPAVLSGAEYFRFVWPWGLGISRRTKRYSKDLRPLGYPGGRKMSWKGFATLLVEKSAAGQETRVILFCAFLALLALIGVTVNAASGRMQLTMPPREETSSNAMIIA